MKRLAVFASGGGTNFQAIEDAARSGRLDTDIALLVCDRPGAGAVRRAGAAGTPVFAFDPGKYPGKPAFEKEILVYLRRHNIDFIALAGYMRLIGPTLLAAYQGRMVNIHPSLLPSFPGRDAIGQALRHGVRVTGVTVHYVDAGMDTGQIAAQRPVIIEDGETLGSLEQKIHCVEHELYAATLQKLLRKAE